MQCQPCQLYPLTFQGNKANPAQIEALRREYQGTVDNLTAKLITTEEALMTQREEFMQMRSKWKDMKSELETIPVLKAQVATGSPIYFNPTGSWSGYETVINRSYVRYTSQVHCKRLIYT